MSQIKRGTNIIILKVVSLCFVDVTLHETKSYYNIPRLHRERRPEAESLELLSSESLESS